MTDKHVVGVGDDSIDGNPLGSTDNDRVGELIGKELSAILGDSVS